jgi:hypothetical protein
MTPAVAATVLLAATATMSSTPTLTPTKLLRATAMPTVVQGAIARSPFVLEPSEALSAELASISRISWANTWISFLTLVTLIVTVLVTNRMAIQTARMAQRTADAVGIYEKIYQASQRPFVIVRAPKPPRPGEEAHSLAIELEAINASDVAALNVRCHLTVDFISIEPNGEQILSREIDSSATKLLLAPAPHGVESLHFQVSAFPGWNAALYGPPATHTLRLTVKTSYESMTHEWQSNTVWYQHDPRRDQFMFLDYEIGIDGKTNSLEADHP